MYVHTKRERKGIFGTPKIEYPCRHSPPGCAYVYVRIVKLANVEFHENMVKNRIIFHTKLNSSYRVIKYKSVILINFG